MCKLKFSFNSFLQLGIITCLMLTITAGCAQTSKKRPARETEKEVKPAAFILQETDFDKFKRCGISPINAKRIRKYFENLKAYLTDSLEDSTQYSVNIYNAQLYTASLFRMAVNCQEPRFFLDLMDVFLIPFKHLKEVHPKDYRWINVTEKTERMLNSTQFMYALTLLTKQVILISQNLSHPKIESYLKRVVPFIKSTLIRWIREDSMWHWSVCTKSKDPLTTYRLSKYVDLKLKRKLGREKNAPNYCNTIVEEEFWTGASVIQYLSIEREQIYRPSSLTLKERRTFLRYARQSVKLFESRLEFETIENPLCQKGCTILKFDADGFRDHPSFPKTVWKEKQTAWDISHASRLVEWIEAFYQYPKISKPKYSLQNISIGFANTFAYRVFNGDFEHPRFTNYLNGENVKYRYYDPYDLSYAYLYGGFGFWARYNPHLSKINQIILDFFDGRKEDSFFQSFLTEEKKDYDIYYILPFLSSLSVPIEE